MRSTMRPAELVRAYRPLDTAAYLRTHGWNHIETVDDLFSIWKKRWPNKEEFEVLLPMALQAPDLPARIADLVETVRTEERRSWEDVWEDLSSPYCDIVRARLLANEEGVTLPLEDGAAAFQYARDLLLAAACSAWKPRAVFGPRKADQALQLVRAARLGQTRPGSYVIKIITSLIDSSQKSGLFPEDDVPYPRRAMTTLANALHAAIEGVRESAAGGKISVMEKRTTAGVSANLCDALAGLGRIGRGIEFTFSWAPAHSPPPDIGTRFELPVDAVVHLEQAARWFRQTATLEEVEFFGSVHRLVKVNDDTDLVTMIGAINGEPRTVRCHVEGETRRLVTKAHHDRSPIICTGDLVKEGKVYHLKNVREIQILDDEE
jgi:hypothetical protein